MNRNRIRWIIIITSFIIISLILWNTYIFFQNFKAEERTKMENWSFAQTEFIKTDTNNTNLDLTLQILNSNTTTPMVAVNKDGSIGTYNNVDETKMNDPKYVQDLINKFKRAKNICSLKPNGITISH